METIDLSLDKPSLIKNNYADDDIRKNIRKEILNDILINISQNKSLALILPENCPIDSIDEFEKYDKGFDYPSIYRNSTKLSCKNVEKNNDTIINKSLKKTCCNIL
jgi:hypothetical protein